MSSPQPQSTNPLTALAAELREHGATELATREALERFRSYFERTAVTAYWQAGLAHVRDDLHLPPSSQSMRDWTTNYERASGRANEAAQDFHAALWRALGDKGAAHRRILMKYDLLCEHEAVPLGHEWLRRNERILGADMVYPHASSPQLTTATAAPFSLAEAVEPPAMHPVLGPTDVEWDALVQGARRVTADREVVLNRGVLKFEDFGMLSNYHRNQLVNTIRDLHSRYPQMDAAIRQALDHEVSPEGYVPALLRHKNPYMSIIDPHDQMTKSLVNEIFIEGTQQHPEIRSDQHFAPERDVPLDATLKWLITLSEHAGLTPPPATPPGLPGAAPRRAVG